MAAVSLSTKPTAIPPVPKIVLTGVGACEIGTNCTWCETTTGFFKSLNMEKWDKIPTEGLTLRHWPKIEWLAMYGDAWRMLRDYFYDPELHGLDWPAIYAKYEPLVHRCNSREDLDDVMKMMSSELSTLHVFVYGGEYREVFTDVALSDGEAVADLGASLKRAGKGFEVDEVYEADPDFPLVEGKEVRAEKARGAKRRCRINSWSFATRFARR